MSTPAESATLILKLYELRREDTMRKAREFMTMFDPSSYEEMLAAFFGPQNTYIRMVVSYWDMAASFVLNGAIDPKMFHDSNGEHLLIFSTLEPFLPQLRQTMENPRFLGHLEQVCLEMPNARERIDSLRARLRKMRQRRKAQSELAPVSAVQQ